MEKVSLPRCATIPSSSLFHSLSSLRSLHSLRTPQTISFINTIATPLIAARIKCHRQWSGLPVDAEVVGAGVGAGAGGEVGEDGGGAVIGGGHRVKAGDEAAFWDKASVPVQEVPSTATRPPCPTMRSRSNRIKESF